MLNYCSAQLLFSWVLRRVIQTGSKCVMLPPVGGTFSWGALLLIFKSLKNLLSVRLTTFISDEKVMWSDSIV